MKTRLILAAGVLCTSIVLARSLDLEWFTVDGVGGTSAGGAFSLNGTVGQSDAFRTSHAAFRLEGGFWAAFVEPALPTNVINLRIARSPMGVLVAWSADYPDYQLEATASLPATNWFTFPMPPVLNGTELQMVLPANATNRFFRLRKP